MHTVSFETAKRLAEAGFPQPIPQRGQTWIEDNYTHDRSGNHHLVLESRSTMEAFCISQDLFLNYSKWLDSELCIFAPTATDILRELPRYSLALLLSYRHQTGEAWFCWDIDQTETFFSHPTNPAEAAAQAWFRENQKP